MAQKTPLFDLHKKQGGKVVDFAGWYLPVSYQGIRQEHVAVRQKAGLFDVSHMGEIEVAGVGAKEFLQQITTNDINSLKDGDSQYSLLLNEEGGILDDVIVYRRSDDNFFLCVNASNTDKDTAWMEQQASGFQKVTITNQSARYGLIAIQGPKAISIVEKMTSIQLAALKRFSFVEGGLQGVPTLLSRTGYTGEDGFEIFTPWDKTEMLWKALLEAGQKEGLIPVGLGARDTLRVEMKYPLYGHEIDTTTSPLEAGLEWTVKLDKGNFIGKESLIQLKNKGVSRKLICLMMNEPGIAREGYSLYSVDPKQTNPIGKVTSGTFSPSLEKGIAIAYVEALHSTIDTELMVAIRDKKRLAKIVPSPFYRKENLT